MVEAHEAPAAAGTERRGELDWADVARTLSRPSAAFGWVFAALVLAVAVFAALATVQPLSLAGEGIADIGRILAPLVLVAAFIERAVEVILTPWRGDEADVMKRNVRALTKAGKTEAAQSEAVRLRKHKNGTRRRAFMLAVGLGMFAALVGFRALNALVEAAPTQGWFPLFDVVVTGLVLGGGADGIHKPVEAFTEYMEMIADSAREKANT